MWKVMIADDEAYIREVMQNLVPWEKLGCRLVYVAENGSDLIDRLEMNRPDIVVTDVKMPKTDGLMVCRHIHETCPEVQVILLSAYSEFEYARMGIKYDVCGYVLKTDIFDELPLAVEKAIHNLEKQQTEVLNTLKEEGRGSEPLIQQMENYISQWYTKKITLVDMAEALHANPSYLSRLYKMKKGENLFDNINRRRLEKAKEYMVDTDMKVYQISDAVGFEDTGYFSRAFKKYTGLTPKEFRSRGKEE